MNYAEYKKRYFELMEKLTQYQPWQAGAVLYSEKLGELVDAHPSEWEDRADEELELLQNQKSNHKMASASGKGIHGVAKKIQQNGLNPKRSTNRM